MYINQERVINMEEGQEVPKVVPDQADILASLQLSEEAKAQLKGNEELLKVITHSIEAKRGANLESKTYREKLEVFETKQREAEAEALKKKGEFEALYNQSQAQLQQEKSKVQSAVINGKLEALGATLGVKKLEYLKLIDIKDVTVDDNLSPVGLEEKVKAFMKDNPDLFGTTAAPVKTDSGKPNVQTPLVDEDMKKLEAKAKSGHVPSIVKLRALRNKK